MSVIIDADAAKLAGLQIDTLQKVRNGQMTLGQWEWFNNLTYSARENLLSNTKKSNSLKKSGKEGVKKLVEPAHSLDVDQKFALLADLGIVTVPNDYVHEKRLTTFGKQNRKKFYYYYDEITDKNFPNPTRVLKPGDKLRVRAFKQVVSGTTTSEERMAFLATQKAIHTGAQGASLVFDQKRDQLPKGKWYASFDEKDRLLQDADGRHGVPGVICDLDGYFGFDLADFELACGGSDAILCFCDVE